jgi:hypothetical protein
LKTIKDKYLPKNIELKAKAICANFGAKLIESSKESKAHQIEVFWGEKSVCDYLYIDRKRGFNTEKNDLQVVIHPELNEILASELIKIDGIRSPNNSGSGKLIDSSQYKGFENRKIGGEYIGAAWRLALSDDLSSFRKFMSIVIPRVIEPESEKKTIIEDDSKVYAEGSKYDVVLSKYERSAAARKKCIEHSGVSCFCCGFNFEEKYGSIGEGFIHIHHIVPLEDIGDSYIVNPIKDLIPLCPNCHAMAHKRKPPFTVLELQELLSEKL